MGDILIDSPTNHYYPPAAPAPSNNSSLAKLGWTAAALAAIGGAGVLGYILKPTPAAPVPVVQAPVNTTNNTTKGFQLELVPPDQPTKQ